MEKRKRRFWEYWEVRRPAWYVMAVPAYAQEQEQGIVQDK